VRVIIGNSMGGMHVWLWGGRYPDFADALVPMVSQPFEMASRNWMLRRLMIETIKADPDYKGGDYTAQPKAMKMAAVFYSTATNGGDIAYQIAVPTRAAADKLVDERLAAPFTADANDFIYAWESSAPTTRRRACRRSPRRCWPSTPPTTSATRPSPASPNRRSARSRARSCCSSREPGQPRARQRRAGEAVCEGAGAWLAGVPRRGGD
jgi:homoserine O-acetyltransferase